jgi:phosphomannomutase
VVRIGLASTDQLYFASGLLDCPGAMFTASHNAAYNGIKLCRAGAKPVGRTPAGRDPREVIDGVPGYHGPAGTATTATCWGSTASSCVRWSTSARCVRCG